MTICFYIEVWVELECETSGTDNKTEFEPCVSSIIINRRFINDFNLRVKPIIHHKDSQEKKNKARYRNLYPKKSNYMK